MGLYVAKMFFLQVDEGFLLYWCLIQKCLREHRQKTFATLSGFWPLNEGWRRSGKGREGMVG